MKSGNFIINGNGTYFFEDGSKYMGEFSDGKIEWYGLLFNSEGEIVFDCNLSATVKQSHEIRTSYTSVSKLIHAMIINTRKSEILPFLKSVFLFYVNRGIVSFNLYALNFYCKMIV